MPSDWIERLHLGSLSMAKGIVSTKPRLKSVYDVLGLVYHFIIVRYVCLDPLPRPYIRGALFVLKCR